MALFYLATNARIEYLSTARPAAETLQAWMRSTSQLAGCSHSQKVGKVQRYKNTETTQSSMILQTIVQLGLVDSSLQLSMDSSAFLATNARIDYLSMARPAAETLQAWLRSLDSCARRVNATPVLQKY